MYINRRCINNRMFTLVYMQCVQSCRLIFHAAVFRHLSLKIMAAIKHFPAVFPSTILVCLCVCVRRFPSCRSRHTLPFFAVTFPLISASVFCRSPSLSFFLCVFIKFDLRQFLCYFPTSPSVPRPPPSHGATVSFVSANVWQFI